MGARTGKQEGRGDAEPHYCWIMSDAVIFSRDLEQLQRRAMIRVQPRPLQHAQRVLREEAKYEEEQQQEGRGGATSHLGP